MPEAIERLRELGYVYQGDKGIPGREAFLWPPGTPVHHLHIRFRDPLRGDPGLAEEYAALKRRLADEHGADRLAYTAAKTAFVERTLRAGPPEGV